MDEPQCNCIDLAAIKFYSKEMPLDVKSVSAEDGVVDVDEFKEIQQLTQQLCM